MCNRVLMALIKCQLGNFCRINCSSIGGALEEFVFQDACTKFKSKQPIPVGDFNIPI